MRLIIMRHGESQNNILSKISREAWRQHRTSEPELSDQGVDECRRTGARMRELGFEFDLMLTSAHKRAVLSLKHVRDTFKSTASSLPPCAIMTEIHEEKGVTMGGEVFPGLTRSQVL